MLESGDAVIESFGQLAINRIIIHEVPRHLRRDTSTSPTYSDVESPLDQELRIFFREKIIETAGSSSAYQVVFDPRSGSPVPRLVVTFLNDSDTDFVEMSKQMAKHLHDAQGGASPGGLVVIADCSMADQRAIGILKLEKEEGVRLREATHQGKRTFDVSYIRDLILTRKTKLFKIGFFVPVEDAQAEGVVCDEQRGYMPQTEVAGFFLTSFLGCKLLEDPRVTTKRFFMAAQDFFNAHLQDPVQRTMALNHLLSELTSQKPRINPRQFAQDYIPTPVRQAFLNHLAAAGVPDQHFRRDIALVKSQTRKMSLEFQNGVAVVGDREAFSESVKVSRSQAGEARVEIIGRLKKVKGK